jgi:hypothetical protein
MASSDPISFLWRISFRVAATKSVSLSKSAGFAWHQLQGEHLLLLAAEQREDALRWHFSQRLAELEIVGELGARLHLASTTT